MAHLTSSIQADVRALAALPSDTPTNVDWESIDRCAALAEGTARECAAGLG